MVTLRPSRSVRTLGVVAGLAALAVAPACGILGGEPPVAGLSASPSTLVLTTTSGGPTEGGIVEITNNNLLDSTGPLDVSWQPGAFFVPTADTCSGQQLPPQGTCELEFTYDAAAGIQSVDSGVTVFDPDHVSLVLVRIEGHTEAP